MGKEKGKLTLDSRLRRGTILESNSIANQASEFNLEREVRSEHAGIIAKGQALMSRRKRMLTSISSETRLATLMAATRRGCVQPIVPYLQYPSSYKN